MVKIYASKEAEILDKAVNLKSRLSEDEFKILFEYHEKAIKYDLEFLEKEYGEEQFELLYSLNMGKQMKPEDFDETSGTVEMIFRKYFSILSKEQLAALKYIRRVNLTISNAKKFIKLQNQLIDFLKKQKGFEVKKETEEIEILEDEQESDENG